MSVGRVALNEAEQEARGAEMKTYLESLTDLEFLQAVLDCAHAKHKEGQSFTMHVYAWDRWQAVRHSLGVMTYRTDREGFLDLCSDLVRRERERIVIETMYRLTQ